MAKPQVPPIEAFPDHVAAVTKLDRIRTRIAELRSECTDAEIVAPAEEWTVDELAEAFLDGGPEAVPAAGAPAAAANDISRIRRELEIARRAEEIQESIVAEQLRLAAAKVCASLESEFLRIADKTATKILEAIVAAREAQRIYEGLVQAGYRQPLGQRQASIERADEFAAALANSDLSAQGVGFGLGPVLRRLAAAGMIEPNHPAARAARIG
jgi:hypothetical protein